MWRKACGTWPRPHLHGCVAKPAVHHGVEMFANIMSGVQRRTTDISKKIDDNLGRLDHTVGQLTEDVVGLKTAVHAAGQRRQKMWWD